jgi:hypothetical protein
MKTLYLLRGLPGSGKSTVAKTFGGLHVEADQYFMEDGVYKFDVTKLGLAHNYCQSQTRGWMKMESDQLSTDTIVVSNTFTEEWEMKSYFDMAEEFGYRVVSLIVENRHGGKSIHDVPVKSLEKMEKRFSLKLK